MKTDKAARRASLDIDLSNDLRKKFMKSQRSDPSLLKNRPNERKATARKKDRVSFREIEEEFESVPQCGNLRGSIDSVGSTRSMMEIELQRSERIAKKKKEQSRKKVEHEVSLLNFQNPQNIDEQHKLNGHHQNGSENGTDHKYDKKISNGFKSDLKDHHDEYASKSKHSSTDCDDSFDLVPSDIIVSDRSGKFRLIMFISIMVFLSVILAVIIAGVKRDNDSPSIRSKVTSSLKNSTVSSNSIYVQLNPEEKDLLDSSHNVVRACIEKETDTPKTCQEYCESKKCCFEESKCETLLTGDECLAYTACYAWITTNTTSSARDSNDR